MYIKAENGDNLYLVFADQAFVMAIDEKTGKPTHVMNVQYGTYRGDNELDRALAQEPREVLIGFHTPDGERIFHVDPARLLMWAPAPKIEQPSRVLE